MVQHAYDGSIWLFDLASLHGVKINDHTVQPRHFHALQPGMALQFGFSTRTYIVRQGVAVGASNGGDYFEQYATSAVKTGKAFSRRASMRGFGFLRRTEAVISE